jgi:hypothetical protein
MVSRDGRIQFWSFDARRRDERGEPRGRTADRHQVPDIDLLSANGGRYSGPAEGCRFDVMGGADARIPDDIGHLGCGGPRCPRQN